jgi:hypothetical protein
MEGISTNDFICAISLANSIINNFGALSKSGMMCRMGIRAFGHFPFKPAFMGLIRGINASSLQIH